jgi:hypothetical protein
MKASRELERFIQPIYAAHATIAGAVRDRNPATTPIPNASNSANPEFMKLPPFMQIQLRVRKMFKPALSDVGTILTDS